MTNQPNSKPAALRVRRGARASWAGSLRNGAGSLSLDSAAAGPLQISLNSRKQNGQAPATSPEELLAGAHAACFSMALRGALAAAGHPQEELTVNVAARCTLRIEGTNWAIESMALEVDVPGLHREELAAAAAAADKACPISQVMHGNTEITIAVTGHTA